MKSSIVTMVAGLATAASASVHFTAGAPAMPARKPAYCYNLYPEGTPCPIQKGEFDQLIDHNNPSLGTFKQRYWLNAEFYAGPGSPIVLSIPGEEAADRMVWYTTNYTLDGTFAQENKGAAIVLEHRYWGESSPFDQMTTKNLRYLTLDNAMQDAIYFARNVKLSIDKNGTTHPDRVPWIATGGSYPGAVVAWINKLYPGTFWASHAVSAVVQPIADFWQYYIPVEEAMPRNCSKDMKLAIRYIDDQLQNRNATRKRALKARFGLPDLEDDDFGWALAAGPQGWQGVQFNTPAKDNKLFQMCDYIEGVGGNVTKPIPGEEGVGACKAASGLAKWLREEVVPTSCDEYGDYFKKGSTKCWDTHDMQSPFFTDRSVRNKWNIQWQWMLCNEPFEGWQGSYPGDTGLVSKMVPTQSLRAQCERFFPDEDGYSYGLKRGLHASDVAKRTDGWHNVNTTRLVYVNGEYDPWLGETVSSPFRPGGPLQSTPEVPVFVVPKAAHCPDLVMANTGANDALHEITQQVIGIISKWVGEFYAEKNISRPGF